MDNEDNKIELFRRMFCEHYPRLVRLAVQLTGDEDEGRDVVSDVMETAWHMVAHLCVQRLPEQIEAPGRGKPPCGTDGGVLSHGDRGRHGGARAAVEAGGGCCRTVGRAYTDSHTVVLLRAQHVQPDRRTPRNPKFCREIILNPCDYFYFYCFCHIQFLF